MIWTLIRYEAKATWRQLCVMPVVAALLLGTAIAVDALRIPLLKEVTLAFALIAIGALLAVQALVCILHYWSSMYGRQGSFTHTIPVRTSTLVSAKMLYAFIVGVVSLIVTVALAAGAVLYFAGIEVARYVIDQIAHVVPANALILGTTGVAIQMTCSLIIVWSVVTLSSDERFWSLRWGAPILGLLCAYIVYEIGAVLSMLFVPFGLRLQGPGTGEIVAEGMWGSLATLIQDSSANPDVLGLGFIPWALLFAVVLFVLAFRHADRRTSVR